MLTVNWVGRQILLVKKVVDLNYLSADSFASLQESIGALHFLKDYLSLRAALKRYANFVH
jgi:hypothetical protein